MRVATLIIGSLACALLCVDGAHAQAVQRFSLHWVRDEGAESCITGRDLTALVQSAFGPVFTTPDQSELAIEGRVSNKGQGELSPWYARIAVSDRNGRVLGVRELSSTAPTCSSLNAQVALVIAMAIDPEAALAGLPAELLEQLGAPSNAADELLAELRSEKAARAAQAASTQPNAKALVAKDAGVGDADVEEKRPPPTDDAASYPRFAVLGQVGLSAELLPRVAPTIGFGVQLQLAPRFSVIASGSWSAPSVLRIDSASTRAASVRFDLAMASLGACVAPLRADVVRIDTCLGGSLLLRSNEARGLAQANEAVLLDPAATLGASFAYLARAPWIVELGVALHVPLRRLRFSYRIAGASDDIELFASAAVGLTAWLGVGVLL